MMGSTSFSKEIVAGEEARRGEEVRRIAARRRTAFLEHRWAQIDTDGHGGTKEDLRIIFHPSTSTGICAPLRKSVFIGV